MKFLTFLLVVLLAGCALVDPSTEVGQALHQLNQAYKEKDIEAFMSLVSPDYQGNLENLKTAVENDFAGFTEVDYRTSVFQTKVDAKTGVYRSSVYYVKTARSPRYGTNNQSGEAVLTFSKDQNGLKLTNMSDPALYGLILP